MSTLALGVNIENFGVPETLVRSYCLLSGSVCSRFNPIEANLMWTRWVFLYARSEERYADLWWIQRIAARGRRSADGVRWCDRSGGSGVA